MVIAVGTVLESFFFFFFFFTPTGIFGDYEVSVGTGASSDTFQFFY